MTMQIDSRTTPKSPPPQGAWRRSAHLVAVLSLLIAATAAGCSRAFWFQQANKDTYHLIDGKTLDPRWDVPRDNIIPDPRSRFFMPFDPVKPPLPPDDDAAHRYMHRSGNGIKGYKYWHKFGRTFSVENPHWLEAFGLNAEPNNGDCCGGPTELPKLKDLTLEQSIELSYIHSRDYQTQIENLYLSALALTLERFRFAVRYLGFSGEPGTDLEFQSTPNGQDSLSLNSRFGISQMLPTGGQWIVELTNNTLWLFTGENDTTTASTLSFMLVQPLLRAGGRDVALEGLTQAERNVLYSARDLETFRKRFFTDVVGSYLGLMQQRQGITNQRGNIQQLEEQVLVLREISSRRPPRTPVALAEMPPGLAIPPALQGKLQYDDQTKELVWLGPMTDEEARTLTTLSDVPNFRAAANEMIQRLTREVLTLDVAQLETRLASSRNTLRTAERQYEDLLDQYKIQLGLPPDMEVSMDESLLKQFELIDSKLTAITEKIEHFVDTLGAIDDENPDREKLREGVAGLQALIAELRPEGIDLVKQDMERVREEMKSERFKSRPEDVRERVRRDFERDERLIADVVRQVDDKEARLRALAAKLSQPAVEQQVIVSGLSEALLLRQEVLQQAQSLQVIQIDQRVELIALQEFTMKEDETVATGLRSRLDLMNIRAQVMDSRRRVEVAANALESVLDVRVEGDVLTPVGDNPLDFRADLSNFRAGVSFTAPLDQVAERNAYRVALINFDRARRTYINFEDQVKFQIRQSWRQLSVLGQNFEIARQQVRLAALQLDAVVEEANRPGQEQGTGTQGLNFLNALRDVLDAQNALISIWVDYERNRLSIHRDMGIMQIDPTGIWYDEFYQERAQKQRSRHEELSGNGSTEDAGDNPEAGSDPESEQRLEEPGQLPRQGPAPKGQDPQADRRDRALNDRWRGHSPGRQRSTG